ncbi:MAG: putative Ig domain-containing protein, partial [Pirellulales bacterium]|nr:putative Ig domain-containing protein [Pirellulales bacterium]
NLEDTLTVSLNQSAIDAGVVLVEPMPGADEYGLNWNAADIAAWASGRSLPSELPITLDVVDDHGGSSRVELRLPVRDPNQLPTFPDNYAYRISANRSWEQPIEFENAGGFEITFTLRAVDPSSNNTIPMPAGLSVSRNGGVLQWHPSADLLWDGNDHEDEKDFHFEVTFNDHVQGLTLTRTMTVTVVDPSVFFPFVPEIDTAVTPPPNAVTVDQPLVYQPVLKPPVPEHEGKTAVWSLEEAPEGMTIDGSNGRLSWTPPANMLGQTVAVVMRVASTQGAGTTLPLTLDVRSGNAPPLLATTFPSIWQQGVPFELNVRGHDPEGHHLAYELLSTIGTSPVQEISIDSATGQIVWPNPTTGLHEFIVRAVERYNPSSRHERRLVLSVLDPVKTGSPVNLEPLILGSPQGVTATTGTEFQFDFDVLDPDQPA